MKYKILRTTLVLASASAVLAACNTINPYTGQAKTSRAVKYGAISGAVCGLIGAGESGQRTRNAALDYGAIGAGVGAYMDVQEAKLREQLQGTGVQLTRNGDQLDLIIPGNVTFNTNEFSIRQDFYPALLVASRTVRFSST